jgi:hypothetical protein
MVKIGWTDDYVWTFRTFDEALEFIKKHGRKIVSCKSVEDIKEVMK